MATVLFE